MTPGLRIGRLAERRREVISVTSPKEYRASIIENRAEFQAALHGAQLKWEQKPTTGEGEDSWSPKEVTKHLIGSEWFFANCIAQACGAPALERPTIDDASPAMAAASLTRVGATCDNILRHVSDGDLAKSFVVSATAGEKTVDEMLAIMDSHAKDHINQLKAAAG